MSTREAVAAANRFGLGARPGELAQARDARAWLHRQIEAGAERAALAGLPSSAELLQREAAMRRQRRAEQLRQPGATQPQAGAAQPQAQQDARRPPPPPMRRELARDYLRDIAARYRVAATTERPLAERIVRFWSNHFAVSADKGAARLYAAPMEREAIRAHAFGNFADLLIAVESHPAMLRYLDNVVSVGEGSLRVQRAGRRGGRRRLGLNENLAREILELHTLGVDGGYSQDDVIELARAITGWSVADPGRGAQARMPQADARTGFVFRVAAHEPGARRVLGRTYAEGDAQQGRAILRDLARHPATARHVSAKLARHLVADAPDPALVRRMSQAWLDSGGELRTVYAALVDHDAAWSADARKFKTPDDFLVSAMRAGGFALDARPQQLVGLLRGLGQPVFTPRSPEGFPDAFGDWAAGDALRKRLQVASTLAARVSDQRAPLALAQQVLGEAAVRGDFANALQRAGSPREGYALLFASPAFQWRA